MLSRLSATLGAAATAATLIAAPVCAEMELSFYSGYQTLPHSDLEGTHPTTGAFKKFIGWEGKSFSPPPYYGARAMWWQSNNIAYGVELTHTKAYAPAAEMPAGFSRLEFSDGHNIVTANVMKRWPGKWNAITPYVGGGVGLAIPHVDATVNGFHTYGYQVTGPALRLTAGAKYDLNDKWALFSEYQFTASWNKADLDGGGSMETRLYTNAINFGISYKF